MPTQSIHCVMCAQPMKKVRVAGGTEVDVCDEHGVWLDVGELNAIVSHHEAAVKRAGGGGAPERSLVGQLGERLASSAASGVGFGAGTALASSLIRRLLG